MGAKHKLNGSYLNGALIVAGVVGLATGSVVVFGVTLMGMLASSFIAGDIRR